MLDDQDNFVDPEISDICDQLSETKVVRSTNIRAEVFVTNQNNKKQMLMQIMVLETKNGIYMKMKSFFKDYKQEKMV